MSLAFIQQAACLALGLTLGFAQREAFEMLRGTIAMVAKAAKFSK